MSVSFIQFSRQRSPDFAAADCDFQSTLIRVSHKTEATRKKMKGISPAWIPGVISVSSH